MKKHFAVLAIAATLAAPAFAEGFYAGADIGRSKLSVDSDGYDISKSDTTYSVFGGYQFHKNFAAELGYRDLGKVSNYGYSIKAHALQASIVGSLPVSDVVDVYGRLGFGRVKAEDNVGDSVNKTKALYGIGARFAVDKNFGVRAEYSRFAKIDDVTLSALTVGADYRF